MVELIMSMTLLVVGLLATVSTLHGARSLVSTAERQSTATARGQREIERLRSVPYSALAQRATVTPSADATLPTHYVPSGTQVVAGTGIQQQSWSDGRMSGTVDVYVTWADDPCCAGSQDYKRVVVAIKLTGNQSQQRLKRPIVLTTNVRSREAP